MEKGVWKGEVDVGWAVIMYQGKSDGRGFLDWVDGVKVDAVLFYAKGL